MFQSLSRRRVMALVVLTCILLITLDKRGNPVIDRVRSVFSKVMQPFDTATEAVALPIERTWYAISNYDDLEAENNVLRDRIETMKGNDIEARSAVLEYQELLRLNLLTSKLTFKNVLAQVVGDSPSNFQNTVEINVGTRDGVAVGMPVTDGAGLIGKITKVFSDRSLVLLITDPEYAISAQVLTTSEEPVDEPATGSTSLSGVPVGDLSSTTSSSSTTTTSSTIAGEIGGNTTTSSTTSTTSSTVAGQTTTSSTTPIEVVRETGTLEGQGADRPLVLRFVDSNTSITNVRVGSIVDTAGGRKSLAPQGIPIGIITAIRAQAGTSSALVEVTPNASLKRLNFVAVVLYVPNQDAVGS